MIAGAPALHDLPRGGGRGPELAGFSAALDELRVVAR
jgi:hypothetical protein